MHRNEENPCISAILQIGIRLDFFCLFSQFRKKLQSSGGSSLRSQRLDDDEAHFVDGGHVTLMTVQQPSIESHGSEDDLVSL